MELCGKVNFHPLISGIAYLCPSRSGLAGVVEIEGLAGDVLFYLTGNLSKAWKTKVLNILRGNSIQGITPYFSLWIPGSRKRT